MWFLDYWSPREPLRVPTNAVIQTRFERPVMPPIDLSLCLCHGLERPAAPMPVPVSHSLPPSLIQLSPTSLPVVRHRRLRRFLVSFSLSALALAQMKLYLRRDVAAYSYRRWGSEEGLEEERSRRDSLKFDRSLSRTKVCEQEINTWVEEEEQKQVDPLERFFGSWL